ncbi:putative oxidoreductase YcjS [compost metagenome]
MMKVAILGCGGMGQVHAQSYLQIPDVQIVGVCDINMELANELGKKTGATAFPSLEAMLEAVNPDVISVTLPSYLHKEYTIKVAEAGKHVICEKPIALNLEDAEAMIHSCESNGVKLFVGHVVRFFPDYVNMKQAVDSDKLGRIGVVHAKRASGHPGNVRDWYNDADLCGGVITDLMIHDIDFVRWTLGEVKSVFAMNRVDAGMEYALVTLVFDNEAVANLEAHWGYPGPFQTAAEIAGSKGVIRSNSNRTHSLQVRVPAVAMNNNRFVEVPQSPGFHGPYELELSHFLDCIRDGRHEPIVTAQDAYKALEISTAALESLRTGKVVHFNSKSVELTEQDLLKQTPKEESQ